VKSEEKITNALKHLTHHLRMNKNLLTWLKSEFKKTDGEPMPTIEAKFIVPSPEAMKRLDKMLQDLWKKSGPYVKDEQGLKYEKQIVVSACLPQFSYDEEGFDAMTVDLVV
jgi:hypothetical protein